MKKIAIMISILNHLENSDFEFDFKSFFSNHDFDFDLESSQR